jgi:hypothetical protein
VVLSDALIRWVSVVCSVRFSLDGTLLAVGIEGAVVLYNLSLGEKLT